MMLKNFALAIGVLAIATATVPANAYDYSTATSSLRVQYDDLDVTHAAGAARLLSRIKSAAERVCAPAPFFSDLKDRRAYRACMDEAIEGAVQKVDSAAVRDLYFGKTPVTIAIRN